MRKRCPIAMGSTGERRATAAMISLCRNRHLAQPRKIGGPFLELCQIELIQADSARQGGHSAATHQFDPGNAGPLRGRRRSRSSLTMSARNKQ